MSSADFGRERSLAKEQWVMPTVAENIVETLKLSGVRRIYGLPGDSLNGFTDALRRDGTIAWEHVRHEEAAAFAAAGEAAITGELAVAAGAAGRAISTS
jgi:pyruvate dehydrogenase (quinone)